MSYKYDTNIQSDYECNECSHLENLLKKERLKNLHLEEEKMKLLKCLKESQDVLVMASLIDKSSTCSNAVDNIDKIFLEIKIDKK